jgi:hypothetical protein
MGDMVKRSHRHWYLREWIKKLGRTQEEVRLLAGISKGRMSALVSCEERWNEDHLTEFASILGIERWQLLDVDPLAKESATVLSIFDAAQKLPRPDRERALKAAQSVIDSFNEEKKA